MLAKISNLSLVLMFLFCVGSGFTQTGKSTLGTATGFRFTEDDLAADSSEYLFEPSAEVVLGFLLSHYLNIYAYQVLLNAKASEQSARMVSMKTATDNADNLINDLRMEYNKLRQGNITRELLEIAGGQAS